MSLKLHNLRPTKGTTKNPKRVGRGPGSGNGVTAGKGSKGQQSRSGYSRQFGREGGQMPVIRRIPKRGFTNIFSERWAVVNLRDLEKLDAGAEITPEFLTQKGIVSRNRTLRGVKVLGTGEIKGARVVKAHAFSESARRKIEQAGGRAEVVPLA
jgi:large subunit ribosomal protein L15